MKYQTKKSIPCQRIYSATPNFNHLFDGTLELLDYLKEKYTLHIITNGFEEVQTLKMKKNLKFSITSQKSSPQNP